tara:strand:+ start:5993 stop:6709 length:717 start_codon:yes stop_codon:yes gene_type:complete
MNLNLLNVTSTEYDYDLVEHFVKHYSRFDIDNWYVILHRSTDREPHEARAFFRSLKPNIRFIEWHDTFLSSEKIKLFNSIISSFDGYVLLSDIDELQQWKQEPKDVLLKQPVVGGNLIDRLPLNSLTKKVDTKVDIFEQFPVKSEISKNISRLYSHKACAFHKSYKLVNSHDLTLYGDPVMYMDDPMIDIAHFRFTDKRLEKTQKRFKEYKKANAAGFPVNYKESEKLINYFKSKLEK